jgi:hypothetical protein
MRPLGTRTLAVLAAPAASALGPRLAFPTRVRENPSRRGDSIRPCAFRTPQPDARPPKVHLPDVRHHSTPTIDPVPTRSPSAIQFWRVVAVVCGLLLASELVGIGLRVSSGRRFSLLDAVAGLVFWFWMAKGAWRRTRPSSVERESPGDAALQTFSARWYILSAALCAVACVVAFVWQRALINR